MIAYTVVAVYRDVEIRNYSEVPFPLYGVQVTTGVAVGPCKYLHDLQKQIDDFLEKHNKVAEEWVTNI